MLFLPPLPPPLHAFDEHITIIIISIITRKFGTPQRSHCVVVLTDKLDCNNENL